MVRCYGLGPAIMKLSAKFALTFLLVMATVLYLDGLLVLRREATLFANDMRNDAALLGEALAGPLRRVWQSSGEQAMLDLVREANKSEHQMRIRWVWLDAPPGDESEPRVPRGELVPPDGPARSLHVERNTNGTRYLYTYTPVVSSGVHIGALELAESFAEQDRYVLATEKRVLVLATIMIGLSTGSAMLIGAWFIGRPVRALSTATSRIASGELDAKVNIHQHDELGTLSQNINRMCDSLARARTEILAETSARVQAVEQLRQADRLRTVGQLTAGIAHELGTPLNVVWARAKMVADGEVSGTEVKANAEIIVKESARITKIIRQLLDFARPHKPTKTRIDLRQVVEHTLHLLEPTARKRGVVLDSQASESVVVEVDGDQIQQILSNLVLNSVQAMPKGGPVSVRLRTRRRLSPPEFGGREGSFACLSVQDAGAGIAPENIDRVFEPFFTTKEVGEGTGLGLSVALGMIKEHGGWIEVESTVGKGSCFTMNLPVG